MKQLSRYGLVLIMVLGLALAVSLLNAHLVPGGDNATYMVLGQSLVTGQGYRMVSDPRMPEMALYPPGYPLLLAGVLALTNTTRDLLAAIVPMKLLSVALYLACLVLIWEFFKKRDAALATIVTLLVAANAEVLHFATEISTEMPYLLFSMLCLVLFDRYLQDPQPRVRKLWWVALCMGLTFYLRTITLVMAVSFVLYLLTRRRYRHALMLAIAMLLLVAPWFVRSSQLPGTGTSVGLGRGYFALYLSNDPYGTARASLPELVSRLEFNVRMYGLEIGPGILFPHALSAKAWVGRIGTCIPLLVSLLAVLGFLLEARRGGAAEWYVALSFASCVGYIWAQSRLVLPLIPFAVYYFVKAVDAIVRLLWRRSAPLHRYALLLACGVLLLSTLVSTSHQIGRNFRYGVGHSVAEDYGLDPVWGNYLAAMDWIAVHGSSDAVVICRKADLMYVLTGRRALEYPYSPDATQLRQAARDSAVAYVIEDAFRWTPTTVDYLKPALRAWQAAEPEELSLAYETAAPQTRVWRVNQ